MPEIAPRWYATSQAVLCLGAAWAIFAMWERGTPVRAGEEGPPARDVGLLWLAAAVLVWGAIGLLLWLPLPPATAFALRPLFSCANSACLLISASHLDYGPDLLQRARERPGWRQGAILGSLAVALVTLGLYAWLGATARVARLPDLALSAVVLLLYGFGLFRSFLKRGFVTLAVLACVAVGLQSLAQVPEITGTIPAIGFGDEERWVLVLASKSLILIAFLSLAMSWVHEVARRPSTAHAELRFTGELAGQKNRRRYVVRIGDVAFEMRETPHRDLLALAVRRVRDATEDGGFVALPDLVGRLDDSRIRRIREDLRAVGLDAVIESNFQKCYRLALPPDRLSFAREALAARPELAEIVGKLPSR